MARPKTVQDGKKRTIYLAESTWRKIKRAARGLGISSSQLLGRMAETTLKSKEQA